MRDSKLSGSALQKLREQYAEKLRTLKFTLEDVVRFLNDNHFDGKHWHSEDFTPPPGHWKTVLYRIFHWRHLIYQPNYIMEALIGPALLLEAYPNMPLWLLVPLVLLPVVPTTILSYEYAGTDAVDSPADAKIDGTSAEKAMKAAGSKFRKSIRTLPSSEKAETPAEDKDEDEESATSRAKEQRYTSASPEPVQSERVDSAEAAKSDEGRQTPVQVEDSSHRSSNWDYPIYKEWLRRVSAKNNFKNFCIYMLCAVQTISIYITINKLLSDDYPAEFNYGFLLPAIALTHAVDDVFSRVIYLSGTLLSVQKFLRHRIQDMARKYHNARLFSFIPSIKPVFWYLALYSPLATVFYLVKVLQEFIEHSEFIPFLKAIYFFMPFVALVALAAIGHVSLFYEKSIAQILANESPVDWSGLFTKPRVPQLADHFENGVQAEMATNPIVRANALTAFAAGIGMTTMIVLDNTSGDDIAWPVGYRTMLITAAILNVLAAIPHKELVVQTSDEPTAEDQEKSASENSTSTWMELKFAAYRSIERVLSLEYYRRIMHWLHSLGTYQKAALLTLSLGTAVAATICHLPALTFMASLVGWASLASFAPSVQHSNLALFCLGKGLFYAGGTTTARAAIFSAANKAFGFNVPLADIALPSDKISPAAIGAIFAVKVVFGTAAASEDGAKLRDVKINPKERGVVSRPIPGLPWTYASKERSSSSTLWGRASEIIRSRLSSTSTSRTTSRGSTASGSWEGGYSRGSEVYRPTEAGGSPPPL